MISFPPEQEGAIENEVTPTFSAREDRISWVTTMTMHGVWSAFNTLLATISDYWAWARWNMLKSAPKTTEYDGDGISLTGSVCLFDLKSAPGRFRSLPAHKKCINQSSDRDI